MHTISSRHEGDLNGRLRPIDKEEGVSVTVVVSKETAHLASTQHTAWMLVNLLCRQERVVGRVGLGCPENVPLAGRVVPLARRGVNLDQALMEGAAAIGGVPVVLGRIGGRLLSVGPNHCDAGDLAVYGEGWWGGISISEISSTAESNLPFGPYIAACLAAGEVFKEARMPSNSYVPVPSVFYSSWLHKSSVSPESEGPSLVMGCEIDVALAGVGAVGSVWMHALWACPDLRGRAVLADNDKDGVDKTNLNRYALFGAGSIGKAKASEAALLAGDADISWEPYDKPFEELPGKYDRVISAVDKNRARQAIQLKYPARILSASTLDLRAELLRCGPAGVGACLRCFNPLEEVESDDAIRERLIHLPEAQLSELSVQIDVPEEELKDYVLTGKCGMASSRLLPYLRENEHGPHQWSVGFVSVLAGTLLAAETVKDSLSVSGPLSDLQQRAVFQFWDPVSKRNGASPYPRDSKCPVCQPDSPATQIWQSREEQLRQKVQATNQLAPGASLQSSNSTV